MTTRERPPTPSAAWVDGGEAPPWALWGADRCEHRARVPGTSGATSPAGRFPDPIHCARQRGHSGDHASPARGPLARYAGGWWAWPDDGFHPEAERRAHTALRREGAEPPEPDPSSEPRCDAPAEIRRYSAGRVAVTETRHPVRCARAAGHALPHRTEPTRRTRPSLTDPERRRPLGRGWTWREWPPPDLPDPTPAQQRRVRNQKVVALLVLVVVVLVWVYAVFHH